MENKTKVEEIKTDIITPWRLMTLIKPILADELVASLRFDRGGIRIVFRNGQKFHLKIEEM